MKNSRRILIFSAVTCIFVIYFNAHFSYTDNLLKIYFLDIGQGDSIYIRTPSGHDMLIDGGISSVVLAKLGEVMPWNDRKIDIVMESHPDADHIGGLPSVLERYEVGMFIEPGVESKNVIDNKLHDLIKEKNIRDVLARRGMKIDFADGAVFGVLFPDKDVSHIKDTNTASIVGQVKYGSTSVMFTGDSPKAIEDYLVSLDGPVLQSNILKAGHHGSRTSSGEVYIKTINPEYVVISAGKNNRYGHPHDEVIKLFERLAIKIARTDKEGTIEFQSDGKSFIKKDAR